MITPRQTRLVRVPDLRAFRRAISILSDTARKPATVLVVPTEGAARQLGRRLSVAEAVTRDGLYWRLHASAADAPRRLSAFERDVMFQAAARGASAGRRIRPGLVSEIIRFYDLLRRQGQQVQRFDELIHERLAGDSDSDPGAARMREQTRFLADTFRDYERRVGDSGACDEHTLREWVLARPARAPIRHIVVTVADWIADPDGLFVADFDLLTRIPGLEQLDIVATEAMLGSGFHERLHTWWPGLDEVEATEIGVELDRVRPALATPATDALWFTVRDREEELIDVARHLQPRDINLERVAVVYKRPLPYLYLGPDTLGAVGIAHQSSDARPLAAEPTSSVVDLVLDFVASGFTRSATVALLRSPHLMFVVDGVEVARKHASALDRTLSDERYLGELDRLARIVSAAKSADAKLAGAAAVLAAQDLAPLTEPAPASFQLQRLASFIEKHLRIVDDADPLAEREKLARLALVAGLGALSDAHGAHDDVAWTIDEMGVAIRRWIEDETFALDRTSSGVQLLDDRAARYGEFDEMFIVGLVEGDWPEKTRRNIFYPSNLMKALGWPSEKDRRSAAEARFLDLVGSAERWVSLYTITLEDEALVEPATLLDELPRARLSAVPRGAAESGSVVAPELAGSAHDAPQFHGQVGIMNARPWSISAIETYLGCPFKFFAQHVLKLEEEPDDEEVMDPRAQGQFVHEVFEDFFRTWQEAGHGAITPSNLAAARDLFATVVDRAGAKLPGAEAALERTRLLGSPAAAGLGEAVFRMEAERPLAVVERLLEHKLEGAFVIATEGGQRSVALRGKADRIDLLADGTFRLIDYKLGWPPDRRKALQLAIYGVCAEQRLAGRHGRDWKLGEAAYLAFKGPRRVVPLFQSEDALAEVLGDAQQRLADALDAIGRGEFPPTPDDVHRCETCAFESVCRKDYVGDV